MAEKVHEVAMGGDLGLSAVVGAPLPLAYAKPKKKGSLGAPLRVDSPLPLKYQIRSISDPPRSARERVLSRGNGTVSSKSVGASSVGKQLLFGDPLPLEYLARPEKGSDAGSVPHETSRPTRGVEMNVPPVVRREEAAHEAQEDLRRRLRNKLQQRREESALSPPQVPPRTSEVALSYGPSVTVPASVEREQENNFPVIELETRLSSLEKRVATLETITIPRGYFFYPTALLLAALFVCIPLLVAD